MIAAIRISVKWLQLLHIVLARSILRHPLIRTAKVEIERVNIWWRYRLIKRQF